MKTTKRTKCTCNCGCAAKRKRGTRRRKTTKRKPTKRKTAKGRSGLNGLDGKVFRLSALQKRRLSPALQRAILERQRRLGKTIIA